MKRRRPLKPDERLLRYKRRKQNELNKIKEENIELTTHVENLQSRVQSQREEIERCHAYERRQSIVERERAERKKWESAALQVDLYVLRLAAIANLEFKIFAAATEVSAGVLVDVGSFLHNIAREKVRK